MGLKDWFMKRKEEAQAERQHKQDVERIYKEEKNNQEIELARLRAKRDTGLKFKAETERMQHVQELRKQPFRSAFDTIEQNKYIQPIVQGVNREAAHAGHYKSAAAKKGKRKVIIQQVVRQYRPQYGGGGEVSGFGGTGGGDGGLRGF